MTLLSVEGLSVTFKSGGALRKATVQAVQDVSFEVAKGEIFALVGESGSGKSTIGRALCRLVDATGSVRLDGVDVLALRGSSLRSYRGRVQMIFQDPFDSLNPVHSLAHHLIRPLKLQGATGDLRTQAAELLDRVGLTPGAQWLDKTPDALSGGQRQRVAIARALAAKPDLILADEPTSMLDVSLRMGILQLLRDLRDERGLALVFITHDLAAARVLADRVGVLYGGRLVEVGPTGSLLQAPSHPYAQLLRASAPGGGHDTPAGPADHVMPAGGCSFEPRCREATATCRTRLPSLIPIGPRHVRCHARPPEPT